MLFPTVTFGLFFVLVFVFSWLLRERADTRKLFLLAASYVFYGWWDWRFCFLLLATSLIAWGAGFRISRSTDNRTRRWSVGTAIAALLINLGFFKYYGFFIGSLQDLLFAAGLQRDLPFLQIVLPVGISFFTFQAISYIVDVYRGEVEARSSPVDVLLYVSFFPQLVAGPIVRASRFLPQLERPPSLTRAQVSEGLMMIVIGLFKKMVIANYLATELVDPVFLDPSAHSSLVVLLGVYGYAVQIFCDFSGYSDMAIGTALLLGYRFIPNFNQPYRAESLRDFWRRWHISLSQWLRDYLYIPLGGSKSGRFKTYRNLFLTMLLGGLWHGAAWNFLIWGALHGTGLAVERRFSGRIGSVFSTRVVTWLLVFHFVCLGWIFFRAEGLNNALELFSALGELSGSLAGVKVWAVAMLLIGLAGQFFPVDLNDRLTGFLTSLSAVSLAGLFAVSMLVIIWISPSGTAPFIYFQF